MRRQIDRLFRSVLEIAVRDQGIIDDEDLVLETLTDADAPAGDIETVAAAVEQADEDAGEAEYVPDADLVCEFAAVLAARTSLSSREAETLARRMVQRARFYFTVGRKRQNVLGEGFEDLLRLLMINVARVPAQNIVVRRRADQLPGFQGTTTRERIEAPDIAIVRDEQTELLASVKWSLRHDRQKQLSDELDCYVDLLTQGRFPTYVLITNEYDPGRLVNTDGLTRRGQRIARIYHVNPLLLQEALAGHHSAEEIRPLIESGRLRSVGEFLAEVAAACAEPK